MPNTLFIQSNNKKSVYYKAKDGVFKGIIDRDYLTDSDIEEIEKQYKNLKVLRLYSIENYLYHPDNIIEINPQGFNYQEYCHEIIKQKNDNLLDIVVRLKDSRKNYQELGEAGINSREDENVIVEKLKSDRFEDFYPYFDMKNKFKRQSLERFNLNSKKLVRTNWFKNQIEKNLK